MHHLRNSIISFVFLTLLASSSWADIKISSITGWSKMSGFSSNGDNSALRIYGGFAGVENAGKCADPDDKNPCDNCVARTNHTFLACNPQRAYKTLRLQITFSSTSIAPSSSTSRFLPVIETVPDDSSATPVTLTPISITPLDGVAGPNIDATIAVEWQELCSKADDDLVIDGGDKDECELSGTQSFRIGFDSAVGTNLNDEGDDSTQITIEFEATDSFKPLLASPQVSEFDASYTTLSACTTAGGGACNFFLRPGDKKATVEKPTLNTNLAGSGHPLGAMVLYCDPTSDFTQIQQSPPTAVLDVVSGSLVKDKITGFSNGTTYSCLAAAQDTAGNIGNFLVLADNKEGCQAISGFDIQCRQFTPDEVIGLFEKEMNCFIATAAYGSPMEKHVKMLREFRNKYLIPNYLGRKFVKLYYAVSPPIARWIAKNPERRAATRALLTPAVWSVSVFMNWSWMLGVAVLFGCGLLALRRKFL
jgi:hypothetical protein